MGIKPRGKNGRFIEYKQGKKRYTAEDIKNAYRAGLNNQTGFTLPSKKIEQYCKAKNIF
jgi:hypothetical protein